MIHINKNHLLNAIEKLELAYDELARIRATLAINFGVKTTKGVRIKGWRKLHTEQFLFEVLQQLIK